MIRGLSYSSKVGLPNETWFTWVPVDVTSTSYYSPLLAALAQVGMNG